MADGTIRRLRRLRGGPLPRLAPVALAALFLVAAWTSIRDGNGSSEAMGRARLGHGGSSRRRPVVGGNVQKRIVSLPQNLDLFEVAEPTVVRPRSRSAGQFSKRSPGTAPQIGDTVLVETLEKDEDVDEEVMQERDSFKAVVEAPQRIDAYLAERYGRPRSYFEHLLDKGVVLINGAARKKSWRGLKDGDIVEVTLLEDESATPLKPEPIPLDVIYEDADILVVNKPPGLAVHPSPGHWSGTLVNGVMHHLGFEDASSLPEAMPGPESHRRPGVVHRLDIGTSGVIVLAKSADALTALSAAFAEREVKKTYLAITSGNRRVYRGHGSGGGHLINYPIGRSKLDRTMMAVLPEAKGGRPSMSVVRSIAEMPDAALLEVRPRTGRTHQIRVHLAEDHVPIMGDDTYGRPKVNRKYSQLAPRPMLHAFRIAFDHPVTGKAMEFEAPLPEDMLPLVQRMSPAEEEDELFDRLSQQRESVATLDKSSSAVTENETEAPAEVRQLSLKERLESNLVARAADYDRLRRYPLR